jgi:type I restriction enzyme R subunit
MELEKIIPTSHLAPACYDRPEFRAAERVDATEATKAYVRHVLQRPLNPNALEMVSAAVVEPVENARPSEDQGNCHNVSLFLLRADEIARDLVSNEKDTPPEEDEDRGTAALTELFQQVKNEKTPVMVERVVADIDEIVRLVRFPGWQTTAGGEREVKKALRKSLLKYQLDQDAELFERAYGYIRQYY